jgi:hypothetical protein
MTQEIKCMYISLRLGTRLHNQIVTGLHIPGPMFRQSNLIGPLASPHHFEREEAYGLTTKGTRSLLGIYPAFGSIRRYIHEMNLS